MAYESKVTNKYFGTTFAGSGKVGVEETELSGLVKALGNSLPQLQEMGNQYITGQQKDAALELESLNASGKSLEDIQQIINSGENDELSSMYATVTNNMWVGKTTAIQDWNSVIADYDNYDPKAQSAEEFVNQYITADFDGAGKHFTGAYASVWNEKKAAFLMQDAENRFKLKNKEEKDSMTAFAMSYKATENDITFYERLQTKIQADGKPPTNAQINAVAYQAVEQFIEAGDYDSAEEFLKTSRGYNGKMEVKSLYASGSAKASDLMKQIRDGRNAKEIKTAAARKERIRLEGNSLLSKYYNGVDENGVALSAEDRKAIGDKLMSKDFIDRFVLYKSVIKDGTNVFGNPIEMEQHKVTILDRFINEEDGFNKFIEHLRDNNVTINGAEYASLEKFFAATQEKFREGFKVNDMPQVKDLLKRVRTEYVIASNKNKKARQEMLMSQIETYVDVELKKWMASDNENIPPSSEASLETKVAYDTLIKNKMQDIYADVTTVFDAKQQLKVLAETSGTILDMTPAETTRNMIRAGTQVLKNNLAFELTDGTVGEYETIKGFEKQSNSTGVPIKTVIKQSDEFERVVLEAKGKLGAEDIDSLVDNIMEEFNIEDNADELMERSKDVVDKFNVLTNTDLSEDDLSVVQQVIDAFTDSDEERQASRVKETLSNLLGYEVSGEYLLEGIAESDLNIAANKFGISLEEFKTVLRRIK
tara:strand:+ start:242 stop:2362 length:2121 start_codon:yes stop_codon:yes gene_type:complete